MATANGDDWMDALLGEVAPFRHVFDREVPPGCLDELMRRATRRRVRVLAKLLPDGRVAVTLKKLVGGE